MRVGVIARAEDRGLGNLTWETYLHVGDYALVVDPGKFGQGFPQHYGRYGGQMLVRWEDDQTLHEATCRAFLDRVDVVYAAETFYDPRLIGWAREQGVATVLHTMPELHKADQAALVDAVWCPTPWRIDEVPARYPARLVPFPVAVDRFPPRRPARDTARVRVLHVAGHRAYADRNGTQLVAAATARIKGRVAVSSQDENIPLGTGAHRWPSSNNYWDLYTDHDILLMPRRFGGLCLPIQEAKAAGLAVVALDTSPHDWYGCVGVPAEAWSTFPTGSGEVTVFTANADAIADAVNGISRSELADLSGASLAWAAEHSWEALTPLWHEEFEKTLASVT